MTLPVIGNIALQAGTPSSVTLRIEYLKFYAGISGVSLSEYLGILVGGLWKDFYNQAQPFRIPFDPAALTPKIQLTLSAIYGGVPVVKTWYMYLTDNAVGSFDISASSGVINATDPEIVALTAAIASANAATASAAGAVTSANTAVANANTAISAANTASSVATQAAQNAIASSVDFVYNTAAQLTAAAVVNGKRSYVLETGEYFEAVGGVQVSRGRLKDYITPEMMGAVGNKIADDGPALQRMCRRIAQFGVKKVLMAGQYRVGRGVPGALAGVIEFHPTDNITGLEIEFVGGGKLWMDNLQANGRDAELSGVYLRGVREVDIYNLDVEWITPPSARGQGYGFCAQGYPQDGNANYSSGVRLHDPRVRYSPQGGIIFLGVDRPRVLRVRTFDTRADALHLNACRDFDLRDHIAVNAGDDGAAFVNYFGPLGYLGGTESYYAPFSLPALSPWSNSGRAQGITVNLGAANGCRINGAQGLEVSGIVARNVQFGLQLDGVKADATNYLWSVQASKNVRVNGVDVDGAQHAVLGTLLGVTRTAGNEIYYQMDVEVTGIRSRNTTNNGVNVIGLEGIRIGTVDTDSRTLLDDGNTRLEKQSGGSVKVNNNSDAFLGTLEGLSYIEVTNTPRIRGRRWEVKNSAQQSIYMAGVLDGECELWDIVNPNRSSIAGVKAWQFVPANVRVARVNVTTDDKPLQLWEWGGGSANSRTQGVYMPDIRLTHTRAGDNDFGQSAQGGQYAPLDCYARVLSRNATLTTFTIVGSDPLGVAQLGNHASIGRSSNFNLATTDTLVPFDNAQADTNGLTDTANNRIKIKRAGLYQLSTSMLILSAVAGDRVTCQIKVNGNEMVKVFEGNVSANGTFSVLGGRILPLNVDDLITVTASCSAARAVNAQASQTYLSATLV